MKCLDLCNPARGWHTVMCPVSHLTASAPQATILRAQFSNRFAAEDGKWNLLFPRGEWHGANLAAIGGSINIDDAFLAEVMANWVAAGKPALPIRVTHRHLDDDVPAKDRLELEKAVGFLTDFRVAADGLEARTEWNGAGKKLVGEGAYAFWSPEWQPKHRDRRTGDVKGWWLSGTALTNDPFFNELPQLAAAVPPAAKESPMNEEQLKLLRAALGLSTTATVEEVLKAASKAGTDVTTLTAEVTKLKGSPDLNATVKAAVDLAVEPLKAENARLASSLLEKDIDTLIATKKRGDGKLGRALVDEKVKPVLLKLVASEKTQAEGLKAAEAYLDAIPCTVPLSGTGNPVKGDGVITASAAHEELQKKADEFRKAGLKGAEPMEMAMRANPELARAAQALTNTRITQEN